MCLDNSHRLLLENESIVSFFSKYWISAFCGTEQLFEISAKVTYSGISMWLHECSLVALTRLKNSLPLTWMLERFFLLLKVSLEFEECVSTDGDCNSSHIFRCVTFQNDQTVTNVILTQTVFIPNAALYRTPQQQPFNIIVVVFNLHGDFSSITHKKAWLLMYMLYKSHKSCKGLCYLGRSYMKCKHVFNVFRLYSMVNIHYVPALLLPSMPQCVK